MLAASLVVAFYLYLALGLLFAMAFVWKGAGRIDPAAGASGFGFRLAILPGSALLWPLLLRRWLALERHR